MKELINALKEGRGNEKELINKMEKVLSEGKINPKLRLEAEETIAEKKRGLT